MNTYSLKRLSLLLSVLLIGAVVFGFTAINPMITWAQAWLRFGILLTAAVGFNLWLFRIIEQHEAEAQRRSEQLAALHKAALILTKEVDLSTVLQRVVDEARVLAEAQYGALGVLDEDRKYIDQFITSGITPQQRALLGPPPRGHGLLGVLIKLGQSIRIPSISDDPRSVGFPPNHPPMRSLLGVLISFQGEILGDLYLTDKLTPSGKVTAFSEQDQQILEMFATQAAIAIKNAQLFEATQHAYEELRKLDDLKTQFINIAAHELRTPLGAMMGYASYAEKRAPEKLRKSMRFLVASTVRMRTERRSSPSSSSISSSVLHWPKTWALAPRSSWMSG